MLCCYWSNFLKIPLLTLDKGIGFGLMYIPAVIACVPYFIKRRSLAIGICLCGTGLGTFFLAPVTHIILTTWGWRSFLTAAALMVIIHHIAVLRKIILDSINDSTPGLHSG